MLGEMKKKFQSKPNHIWQLVRVIIWVIRIFGEIYLAYENLAVLSSIDILYYIGQSS